ncbi:hypothetical protein LJC10_00670 [Selenomonadales bacterium OttesenSCG-928-I06]|nr:hypothetical protein [Selenomonadales bacterium OttesenSCG-928-I06]
MTFKPMLAATIKDINTLKFPLLASPKLDGIRVLIKDSVALSRSLKPIPNKYVQRKLGNPAYNGFDGEIVVGDPTDPTCFRGTGSGVMTIEGEPNFTFWVFDDFTCPNLGYLNRCLYITDRIKWLPINFLPYKWVHNVEEVQQIETQYLKEGYEGVMLRDPNGLYKFGRSTLKEAYLMKLKRFEDSEAQILGFVEQMHNANEPTKNALGHTERSTCKANLVGKDTLGALSVRDLKSGVEFEIGSGFNDETKKYIWENQNEFLGTFVKYKYFPTGSKEKPRFPVFLGFRDAIDI